MAMKNTPPWYGLSWGPMMVACQWNRSSPAGPALHEVGGSFWRSCSAQGGEGDGTRDEYTRSERTRWAETVTVFGIGPRSPRASGSGRRRPFVTRAGRAKAAAISPGAPSEFSSTPWWTPLLLESKKEQGRQTTVLLPHKCAQTLCVRSCVFLRAALPAFGAPARTNKIKPSKT